MFIDDITHDSTKLDGLKLKGFERLMLVISTNDKEEDEMLKFWGR